MCCLSWLSGKFGHLLRISGPRPMLGVRGAAATPDGSFYECCTVLPGHAVDERTEYSACLAAYEHLRCQHFQSVSLPACHAASPRTC